MDVKIKLLDEFCFRFIYFSGLYDIWSHFSRPRMIVFEHKECPAWNTRDVLLGTHEMSCVEHTRCPAWNTRDVLLGTHEMSCLEHKRCRACVRAYVRTYVPLISSMIVSSKHWEQHWSTEDLRATSKDRVMTTWGAGQR